MSYTAEISRKNPSCFLFLVDQSGSMLDGWSGNTNRKKADELATIINRLIQNVVIKCSKSEGIRDYYYVGVIGYGNQTVNSAFHGALAGKDIIPISTIADNPTKIEERTKKVDDGAGGLIDMPIKLPIWFEPVADGDTPMCQALNQAQVIAQKWIDEHPTSFPPIIFNLTDGEATDGDPSIAAEQLKSVSGSDGNVLLFNIHLSSQKSDNPIEFADSAESLPDDFARRLFQMSSILPEHIRNAAKNEGCKISELSRGFSFNSDIVTVIKVLEIGTRPSNLR